jgi:hypothetical protein
MSFVNGSAQGLSPLHHGGRFWSSSYGLGNRATFSDSRSNFHTRVGYRTNVCRRRLASHLARASEAIPAQGALEDHHDRLPGSPHYRLEKLLSPLDTMCLTGQRSLVGGSR